MPRKLDNLSIENLDGDYGVELAASYVALNLGTGSSSTIGNIKGKGLVVSGSNNSINNATNSFELLKIGGDYLTLTQNASAEEAANNTFIGLNFSGAGSNADNSNSSKSAIKIEYGSGNSIEDVIISQIDFNDAAGVIVENTSANNHFLGTYTDPTDKTGKVFEVTACNWSGLSPLIALKGATEGANTFSKAEIHANTVDAGGFAGSSVLNLGLGNNWELSEVNVFDNSAETVVVLDAVASNGTQEIDNCLFSGGTNALVGIQLKRNAKSGSEIYLNNLVVEGVSDYAFIADGGIKTLDVANSEFQSATTFIKLPSVQNLKVRDSEFGVQKIDDGSNPVYYQTTQTSIGDFAINVASVGGSVEVLRNTITGGIKIGNSTVATGNPFLIEENYFGYKNGINDQSLTPLIFNGTKTAIDLKHEGSANLYLDDNGIYGAYANGIVLNTASSSGKTYVLNNYISSHPNGGTCDEVNIQNDGLKIVANSTSTGSRINIEGNDITNCINNGVQIDDAYKDVDVPLGGQYRRLDQEIVISGNTITGNGNYGLYVKDSRYVFVGASGLSQDDYNTALANTFGTNHQGALYFQGVWGSAIKNNSFLDNSASTVCGAALGENHVTLSNCQISEIFSNSFRGLTHGISLKNNSGFVWMLSNTMAGHTGNGILIENSSNDNFQWDPYNTGDTYFDMLSPTIKAPEDLTAFPASLVDDLYAAEYDPFTGKRKLYGETGTIGETVQVFISGDGNEIKPAHAVVNGQTQEAYEHYWYVEFDRDAAGNDCKYKFTATGTRTIQNMWYSFLDYFYAKESGALTLLQIKETSAHSNTYITTPADFNDYTNEFENSLGFEINITSPAVPIHNFGSENPVIAWSGSGTHKYLQIAPVAYSPEGQTILDWENGAVVEASNSVNLGTSQALRDQGMSFTPGKTYAYRVLAAASDISTTTTQYGLTKINLNYDLVTASSDVRKFSVSQATNFYLVPSVYDLDNNNLHTNDINWQLSINYLDNKFNSQSMVYADGLGRTRQVQALSNTTGGLIVSEIAYSEDGPDAVQSMAAPVYDNNGNPISQFGYQHRFFDVDGTNGPRDFGTEDFDRLRVTSAANKTVALIKANPLEQDANNKAGLGYYYSNANEVEVTVDESNGYAFAYSLSSTDQRGVLAATNVGDQFQVGSGHEMRQYVRDISGNSIELARIYGPDYPSDDMVKTLTYDADNVGHISYIDSRGRVMATALETCSANESLKRLDSYNDDNRHGERETDSFYDFVNVLKDNTFNVGEFESVSEVTFDVACTKQDLRLLYNMEASIFPVLDECMTCEYEVEVEIYNEATGEVLRHYTKYLYDPSAHTDYPGAMESIGITENSTLTDAERVKFEQLQGMACDGSNPISIGIFPFDGAATQTSLDGLQCNDSGDGFDVLCGLSQGTYVVRRTVRPLTDPLTKETTLTRAIDNAITETFSDEAALYQQFLTEEQGTEEYVMIRKKLSGLESNPYAYGERCVETLFNPLDYSSLFPNSKFVSIPYKLYGHTDGKLYFVEPNERKKLFSYDYEGNAGLELVFELPAQSQAQITDVNGNQEKVIFLVNDEFLHVSNASASTRQYEGIYLIDSGNIEHLYEVKRGVDNGTHFLFDGTGNYAGHLKEVAIDDLGTIYLGTSLYNYVNNNFQLIAPSDLKVITYPYVNYANVEYAKSNWAGEGNENCTAFNFTLITDIKILDESSSNPELLISTYGGEISKMTIYNTSRNHLLDSNYDHLTAIDYNCGSQSWAFFTYPAPAEADGVVNRKFQVPGGIWMIAMEGNDMLKPEWNNIGILDRQGNHTFRYGTQNVYEDLDGDLSVAAFVNLYTLVNDRSDNLFVNGWDEENQTYTIRMIHASPCTPEENDACKSQLSRATVSYDPNDLPLQDPNPENYCYELRVAENTPNPAGTSCSATIDLEDGLILWYPIEGSVEDVSDLGQNSGGSRWDGDLVYDRFGTDGGAAKISGGHYDGYLTSPSTSYNGASLTFWYQKTSELDQIIMSTFEPYSTWEITDDYNWNDSDDDGQFHLVQEGGKIIFRVKTPDKVIHELVSQTLDNQCWTDITIAWDDTSLKLWVNGEIEDELVLGFNNYALFESYYIYPGKQGPIINKQGIDISAQFESLLSAHLDDIRLYNRALSDEEIAYLYDPSVYSQLQVVVDQAETNLTSFDLKASIPGPQEDSWCSDCIANNDIEEGRIFWLPFEGSMDDQAPYSGQTVNEYGNGYNPGYDYSFLDDASYQSYDIDMLLPLIDNVYSVSFWTKDKDCGNIFTIDVHTEGSSESIYFSISSGQLIYNLDHGTTGTSYLVHNISGEEDNWHFYSLIIEGSNHKVFIDGELRLDVNHYVPYWKKWGYINFPYGCWDGDYDDIAIYNRALSPDEIAYLYHQSCYTPTPAQGACTVAEDPNPIFEQGLNKAFNRLMAQVEANPCIDQTLLFSDPANEDLKTLFEDLNFYFNIYPIEGFMQQATFNGQGQQCGGRQFYAVYDNDQTVPLFSSSQSLYSDLIDGFEVKGNGNFVVNFLDGTSADAGYYAQGFSYLDQVVYKPCPRNDKATFTLTGKPAEPSQKALNGRLVELVAIYQGTSPAIAPGTEYVIGEAFTDLGLDAGDGVTRDGHCFTEIDYLDRTEFDAYDETGLTLINLDGQEQDGLIASETYTLQSLQEDLSLSQAEKDDIANQVAYLYAKQYGTQLDPEQMLITVYDIDPQQEQIALLDEDLKLLNGSNNTYTGLSDFNRSFQLIKLSYPPMSCEEQCDVVERETDCEQNCFEQKQKYIALIEKEQQLLYDNYGAPGQPFAGGITLDGNNYSVQELAESELTIAQWGELDYVNGAEDIADGLEEIAKLRYAVNYFDMDACIKQCNGDLTPEPEDCYFTFYSDLQTIITSVLADYNNVNPNQNIQNQTGDFKDTCFQNYLQSSTIPWTDDPNDLVAINADNIDEYPFLVAPAYLKYGVHQDPDPRTYGMMLPPVVLDFLSIALAEDGCYNQSDVTSNTEAYSYLTEYRNCIEITADFEGAACRQQRNICLPAAYSIDEDLNIEGTTQAITLSETGTGTYVYGITDFSPYQSDAQGNGPGIFIRTDSVTENTTRTYDVSEETLRCLASLNCEAGNALEGFKRSYIREELLSYFPSDPDGYQEVEDLIFESKGQGTMNDLIRYVDAYKEKLDCINACNNVRKEDFDIWKTNLRNQITDAITDAYTNACFAELKENFSIKYEKQIGHYTLYEYNERNQLIATVPPAGVDVQVIDLEDNVAVFDIDNDTRIADHQMRTTYDYNSMGELIATNNPDYGDPYLRAAENTARPEHGQTLYLYDKAGRIRFSQTEEQRQREQSYSPVHVIFSYTIYDEETGRIAEVGEFNNSRSQGLHAFSGFGSNFSTAESTVDYSLYPAVDRGGYFPESAFQDESFFHYDFPEDGNDIGQSYLLNRVSYIENDESKSYFSYDVHGRVKWSQQVTLAGVNPGLNQDLVTKVEYHYQPVSSLVNYTVFQDDVDEERLVHYYTYDDDLRLKSVYVSRAAGIDYSTTPSEQTLADEWMHAVTYNYFQHGGLKNKVLGDDYQVVDYIYNLQGWLKAINDPSGNQNWQADDRQGNAQAEDLFAEVVNYYKGDYLGDGVSGQGTETLFKSLDPTAGTAYNDRFKELFSGNIAGTISRNTYLNDADPITEEVLVQTHQYDVLNRLVQSKSEVFMPGGTTWAANELMASVSEDDERDYRYRVDIDYDPSGNIENLTRYAYNRNGNTFENQLTASLDGAENMHLMDKMHYEYAYKDKSDHISDTYFKMNNRLLTVNDEYDIQSTGNTYDDIYDIQGWENTVGQLAGGVVPSSPNLGLADTTGAIPIQYRERNKTTGAIEGDLYTYYFVPSGADWSVQEEGLNHLVVSGGTLYAKDGDRLPLILTVENGSLVTNGNVGAMDINLDNATLVNNGQLTSYSSSNALDTYADFTANNSQIENYGTLTPYEIIIDANSSLVNTGTLDVYEVENFGPVDNYGVYAGHYIRVRTGAFVQQHAGAEINAWKLFLDGEIRGDANFYTEVDVQKIPPYTSNIRNIVGTGSFTGKLHLQFLEADLPTGFTVSDNEVLFLNETPPAGQELVFDQTAENTHAFNYDHKGRLTRDLENGIAEIRWNAYDKVVAVVSAKPNERPNLYIHYNGSGRRVSKHAEYSDHHVYTYYAYDASGRQVAFYSHNTADNETAPKLNELPIYGMGRVGAVNQETYTNALPAQAGLTTADMLNGLTLAMKYELTDHIGNVRTVFGAVIPAEAGISPSGITMAAFYAADYYPYGMVMPGREAKSESYRYGFQGMERDVDFARGNGNSYTTEFRQYDARLGRWLTLDPLKAKYPGIAPYVAFNNNPVYFVDPRGLEGDSRGNTDGTDDRTKYWVGGDSGDWDNPDNWSYDDPNAPTVEERVEETIEKVEESVKSAVNITISAAETVWDVSSDWWYNNFGAGRYYHMYNFDSGGGLISSNGDESLFDQANLGVNPLDGSASGKKDLEYGLKTISAVIAIGTAGTSLLLEGTTYATVITVAGGINGADDLVGLTSTDGQTAIQAVFGDEVGTNIKVTVTLLGGLQSAKDIMASEKLSDVSHTIISFYNDAGNIEYALIETILEK